MKTQQKHTPTPWKVLYETNIFGSGEQNAIANCGDREVHGIEQCKANAEFIVRAVNNFDDSLLVMRHALAEIKGEGVLVKEVLIGWLEKAIAKAEGQP